MAKFVSTLIKIETLLYMVIRFHRITLIIAILKYRKELELYRFNLLYITCMLHRGEMHFEFNTAETGESRK